MEIKETIKIKASSSLSDMGLGFLVGSTLKVVECRYGRTSGKLIGVWVELKEPYLDEIEWFIPAESIEE